MTIHRSAEVQPSAVKYGSSNAGPNADCGSRNEDARGRSVEEKGCLLRCIVGISSSRCMKQVYCLGGVVRGLVYGGRVVRESLDE